MIETVRPKWMTQKESVLVAGTLAVGVTAGIAWKISSAQRGPPTLETAPSAAKQRSSSRLRQGSTGKTRPNPGSRPTSRSRARAESAIDEVAVTKAPVVVWPSAEENETKESSKKSDSENPESSRQLLENRMDSARTTLRGEKKPGSVHPNSSLEMPAAVSERTTHTINEHTPQKGYKQETPRKAQETASDEFHTPNMQPPRESPRLVTVEEERRQRSLAERKAERRRSIQDQAST